MKKLLLILFMFPMLAVGQQHMMSVLASQESGGGIKYVESTSIVAGTTASTTSITINYSSNEDDFLILCVMVSESQTFSTPSGWSEFNATQGAESSLSVAYFYKFAGGSEPGSVEVSWGSGFSSGVYAGVIHRFSGITSITRDPTIGVYIAYDNDFSIASQTGYTGKQIAFWIVEDNTSVSDWGDLTELSEQTTSTGSDAGFYLGWRDETGGITKSTSVTMSASDYRSMKYISVN